MNASQILTLLLAKRSIFRNTRRTVLTVFLISFSLSAILFTDAFVNGTVATMVKGTTETFLGDAQIHRKGFREANDVDLYLENPSNIYRRIDQHEEITHFAPRVFMGGMLSSSENMVAGAIYGISPEKESQISKVKKAVIQGDYLSGKSQEILLGKEMIDLLEVDLGGRVVVTVSQANGGELSQALFRVSGIFSFSDRTMDSSMAFVNLAQGQSLLNIEGVHEIALRFDDIERGTDQSLSLWQDLNDDRLETLNWRDLLPKIDSIIAMSRYSTLMVSIIMYILVALGLINTMFMSIYERKTEFGILLAIGTRPAQLFKQIMIEGLLIGLLSAVIGLLIGGTIAYIGSVIGFDYTELEMSGVSLNEPIYLIIEPLNFALIALSTVAITLLACIYPAAHTANLLPSFAMRKTL